MTVSVTPLPPIQTCADCSVDFPLDRTTCPHCARPSLFPNVAMANQEHEIRKLDDRFQAAKADADQRGCRDNVDQFSDDCRQTSAVMRCDLLRLHRQIASGSQIFAPYYDLERLQLRMNSSDGFDFEKLRPQAEIELLGNAKHIEQIHYACLDKKKVRADKKKVRGLILRHLEVGFGTPVANARAAPPNYSVSNAAITCA